MYITSSTRSFPVEGQAGTTVVTRKLKRKQLREAREARQVEGVQKMRRFGGAAFVRELNDVKEDADREAKQKAELDAHPSIEFDEDTLLSQAVVGIDPMPFESLADALDSLDEPTATFIADEIIAHSRGQREDPVAEKNA